MKKIASRLFLVLIVLAAVSCKKTTVPEAQSETGAVKDANKAFLKEVVSDNPDEYYISGEFDDSKIYCASTHSDRFPYHDTIFNAMWVNTEIGLDNIHLVRQNKEQSVIMAIYFDKANIFTRQFPYILPRANLDQCEAAQMEIIDLKAMSKSGPVVLQDKFTFWGTTNQSIKLVVTSFVNNVMEGTFSGVLALKTGPNSKITVKNGKFRIKIKIV